MFPRVFRSLEWLRALNVVGVGLALAAVASAACGLLFPGILGFDRTFLTTLVPTLPIAALWALLLRLRVLQARPWLAFLFSLPLAFGVEVLTLHLRDAMLFDGSPLDPIDPRTIGAATSDLPLWTTFLAASWLLFGLPIRRAAELARQGLAGEERGEHAIGQVVTGMSLVALLTYLLPQQTERSAYWALYGPQGHGGLAWAGTLGLMAGAVTTLLSRQRERRRRWFVQQVEEGRIAGFRVEALPEGKALIRVATASREDYRVADVDAELFALDEQGAALRPGRLDASS